MTAIILNSSVLTLAAAGAVACLVGWVVYCQYLHPLKSIPGPFLASFSRAWIVYKTAKGDMDVTQRALHQKYGPLVRIAPDEVSVSDPEAIKIIYGTKNVFTKSNYYEVWVRRQKEYVCYKGHFAERDEKKHTARRRITNSLYSMASVLDSEDAINSCTELFCDYLRDSARKGSVVDLSRWTNMYAFDVLGELFFGEKFGFLATGTDIGNFMQLVDTVLYPFALAGFAPTYLMRPLILSQVPFSSSLRSAGSANGALRATATALIDKRKRQIANKEDDKGDILRKLLELKESHGEKVNFADPDIQREAVSSLFAGSDTTSVAINSIFYHLLRTPAAYAKLTAEVDAAIADGSLTIPVAYSQAIKLPYLRACINEGMRMHPSVGLNMPRIVPAGGATIAGFHFPAGFVVGMSAAVVQRDRDVFGSDADTFNPDRWLEGDVSRMDRTMIVFGAGPRVCIGKNISISELYKLIPQLVRLFNMRLANPDREWQTKNYWFHKQTGVDVVFEERKLD